MTSNRSSVPDASLRDFLASFEEGTRRFMNGDTSLWKENVSRRSDAMIMGLGVPTRKAGRRSPPATIGRAPGSETAERAWRSNT